MSTPTIQPSTSIPPIVQPTSLESVTASLTRVATATARATTGVSSFVPTWYQSLSITSLAPSSRPNRPLQEYYDEERRERTKFLLVIVAICVGIVVAIGVSVWCCCRCSRRHTRPTSRSFWRAQPVTTTIISSPVTARAQSLADIEALRAQRLARSLAYSASSNDTPNPWGTTVMQELERSYGHVPLPALEAIRESREQGGRGRGHTLYANPRDPEAGVVLPAPAYTRDAADSEDPPPKYA